MGSQRNKRTHRHTRLYSFNTKRHKQSKPAKPYSVEKVSSGQFVSRTKISNVDSEIKIIHAKEKRGPPSTGQNSTYFVHKNVCTAITSNLDGCRIVNLDILSQHIHNLTLHAATCDACRIVAHNSGEAIRLHGEVNREGLASVLFAKCCGCSKEWHLQTSNKVKGPTGNRRWEINLAAIWGQMGTGGGAQGMNQFLSTMGVPGIPPSTFSAIEEQIGLWWKEILDQEMRKAGELEKEIAIREGSFFQGVPKIAVIADGGWSKRSHKHSYVAYSGVGVVIGRRTGKILGIGIRNKYCATCNLAQSRGEDPPDHTCYRNWDLSSPAMEPDIILELFLEGERIHGLRYLTLVGDGDSSVLHILHTKIPIWGAYIEKIECANHVCKNIRSSLENLVKANPSYKGRGRLTQNNRRRIAVGIRCAIKNRSAEPDKLKATRLLQKDILNSGQHVMGNHTHCNRDFCKKAPFSEQNSSDPVTKNLHIEDQCLDSPSINSTNIEGSRALTTQIPVGFSNVCQQQHHPVLHDHSYPATRSVTILDHAYCLTNSPDYSADRLAIVSCPSYLDPELDSSSHDSNLTYNTYTDRRGGLLSLAESGSGTDHQSGSSSHGTEVTDTTCNDTTSSLFSLAQLLGTGRSQEVGSGLEETMTDAQSTDLTDSTDTADRRVQMLGTGRSQEVGSGFEETMTDAQSTDMTDSTDIDDRAAQTDLNHFLAKQQEWAEEVETVTDSDMTQARYESPDILVQKDPIFDKMMADILFILSRYAGKSGRLIENTTTNLAECYMSIRTRLDGGKQTFRSAHGSFNHRSVGAALRLNMGPTWSPAVWTSVFSEPPNRIFTGEFLNRQKIHEQHMQYQSDPIIIENKKKKKYARTSESVSKPSREAYNRDGEQCPLDIPDVNEDSLKTLTESYVSTNVRVSAERAVLIEQQTRLQSESGIWAQERHCRLTASNFGTVFGLRKTTCVHKTLQTIIYSRFLGNVHTRYGLDQEPHTAADYIRYMQQVHNAKVTVRPVGLMISLEDNCLAGSPDALVTDNRTEQDGLAEFKNLSAHRDQTVQDLFVQKESSTAKNKWGNFCLRRESKGSDKIILHKKHHYYYQVQGLLLVTRMPWLDFVLRAKDIYVQRIYPDIALWSKMRPKLLAFYNKCMLPELASPRHPGMMRDCTNWV